MMRIFSVLILLLLATSAVLQAQDSWNRCEIGITCVSNEAAHADSMLATVINFIESNGWLEITDYSTELVYVD